MEKELTCTSLTPTIRFVHHCSACFQPPYWCAIALEGMGARVPHHHTEGYHATSPARWGQTAALSLCREVAHHLPRIHGDPEPRGHDGCTRQGRSQSLRTRHFAASARGDVAGALALDTEEAVIDGTVGLCAAPCVGKTVIQKELESRVAIQVRAIGLKYYMSGNVVTTRFEVQNDNTEKAGATASSGGTFLR